jgi:tetratricopeptide (TPR) repeat protein
VEIMSFANHRAALEWLRQEYSPIHASWLRARELADSAYVWQLATRFSAYLEYCADWSRMEEMLSVASVAAREGQAIDVQAQVCRVLGQTLIRLERYQDARRRLLESSACYRETGDLAGMAHVERLLAWSYERESRPGDMIEHAMRGVEIARELDDDATIGRALNGLGWFYALDGKLTEARDCCESALTLLRATADRFGQAETLDSLGLIHFRMGDFASGEKYYLESAELFTGFGHEFNAADTLANLGDALAAAGMPDEATAVWTSALVALRRLGSTHAQAVQDRIAATERTSRALDDAAHAGDI